MLKAELLTMRGDRPGAIATYEYVLRRFPRFAAAYALLAPLLAEEGRHEEAARAAANALALDPSHESLRALAGEAQPDYHQVVPIPPPTAVDSSGGAGTGHVGRFGSTFTGLGWGLAIISFGLTIFASQRLIRAAQHPSIADGTPVTPGEAQRVLGGDFNAFITLGLLVWFLTLLWITLDLADRRGSWAWLVLALVFALPCFLAPFCGPGWFLLPIYLAFGRARKR